MEAVEKALQGGIGRRYFQFLLEDRFGFVLFVCSRERLQRPHQVLGAIGKREKVWHGVSSREHRFAQQRNRFRCRFTELAESFPSIEEANSEDLSVSTPLRPNRSGS